MRFAHGLLSFLTLLALAIADSNEKNDSATINATIKSLNHTASTSSTKTSGPLKEPSSTRLSENLGKLLGESLNQMLEEVEEGGGENHSTTDDATGGARAQEPFNLAQLSLVLADTRETPLDEFHAVSSQHQDVKKLVEQFMRAYQAEVEATNLNADIIHVIKAEATELRPVLAERDVGLGIELIKEELAREYRVFLLVKHRFKSSMFTDKRPYVTVLRVSMSCTNQTEESRTSSAEFACDLINHVDLPRVNESTTDVPDYIRHAIAHSVPSSSKKNAKGSNTTSVFFVAIEAQDILYNAAGLPVRGEETIESVRFRVSSGSDAQDCMVVVQHARGISTLLYSDSVCYDDLATQSVAMVAYQYTKDNYLTVSLVAALFGAFVATALIYRRRSRHRSGYSYLHSKNGQRLPRLASHSSSKNTVGGIGELAATAS